MHISDQKYPGIKFLSYKMDDEAVNAGYQLSFSQTLTQPARNLFYTLMAYVLEGQDVQPFVKKAFYISNITLLRLQTLNWTDDYGPFFRKNLVAQCGVFVLEDGNHILFAYPEIDLCEKLFNVKERVLIAAFLKSSLCFDAEAGILLNRNIQMLTCSNPKDLSSGSLLQIVLPIFLHVNHYAFVKTIPAENNDTGVPIYIVD